MLPQFNADGALASVQLNVGIFQRAVYPSAVLPRARRFRTRADDAIKTAIERDTVAQRGLPRPLL